MTAQRYHTSFQSQTEFVNIQLNRASKTPRLRQCLFVYIALELPVFVSSGVYVPSHLHFVEIYMLMLTLCGPHKLSDCL